MSRFCHNCLLTLMVLKSGEFVVEGLERGDVALVCRAVWDRSSRRLCLGTVSCSLPTERALSRNQSCRAIQLFGIVQREGIRQHCLYRSGVGPAQQPVLAVGEDAHAYAVLFLRLREVVVELVDVLGVGVEAARGADPALELDERVEGGEVHGAARAFGRRVFLDYLLVLYEAGDGQEVADRAGDVGFGLADVVPPQNLGCGLLGIGIVWIDVQ